MSKGNVKIYYLLLTLTVIVLIANVLPTFYIGFYQDDFKSFLDPVQFADGDFSKLLFTNGLGAGYRPLAAWDRIIFFELFGENYIAHRLYLVLIHVLYGLILFRIIRLFSVDRSVAIFSVFFYFSMVFTRQTIYSSVALSYSDFAIMIFIYLLLRAFRLKAMTYPLVISLWLIFVFGLLNRENSISLLPIAFIIVFAHWATIANKKIILTFLSGMIVISAGYFIIYFQKTAEIAQRTIGSSELSTSGVKNVLFGTFTSVMAPFQNLYYVLRGLYNVDKVTSIVALTTVFVLALVLIVRVYRFLRVKVSVKRLNTFFFFLVAICFSLLAPYVLNGYFEARMMVITFAFGAAIWGVFIGSLIIGFIDRLGKTNRYLAILLASLFVIPSIGAPISKEIKEEYQASIELRELTDSLVFEGYDTILIANFDKEDSILRSGNAKGIIRYVSKRKAKISTVHELNAEETIAIMPGTPVIIPKTGEKTKFQYVKYSELINNKIQ